ncbi:MAG: primosomal protein N' [Chloroflexota bacterium]
MTTFVEIAVNIPQVSGVFHYHLPPELDGQVIAGCLVIVPFGKQTVQGIVLGTVDDTTVPQTKPVLELLDPEPVVTQAQIDLAKHLSESSLTPLAACISLMLPPGLSQMADTVYRLTTSGERTGDRRPATDDRRPTTDDDRPATADDGQQSATCGILPSALCPPSSVLRQELTDAQTRLLKLLQERGPLRGRQIARALPHRNWQATTQALKRRGLVTTEATLKSPTVRPKMVRTAQLACSPGAAEAQMENLGRKGAAAIGRRQKMVRFLLRERGPVDASWVYAESGGNLADLKKLAAMGLVFLGENETVRDPLKDLDFVLTEAPALTREQESVWGEVKAGIQRTRAGESVAPFLLYGVTGSGKTEIYLQAVEAVIRQGRQAIVLVPEIALTPQTVRRFVSRFPDKVGLVHSRLSPGERYDTWRRARAGLISLVVGPRSALFTPFANLGLIVVDECHDQSYYQGDTPPSYHAREASAVYARQVGAVCLMGSATPDIVSTYRAARGYWTALSLPERILAHKEAVRLQMQRVTETCQVSENLAGLTHFRPLEKDAETTDLPPVRVVDMREELKSGNRSIFSRPLQAALSEVLAHGLQAILFLNRRGMATYIFCRDCGYALKCPRCDIPLTYHTQPPQHPGTQSLICHRCGYRRHKPRTCPQCKSTRIKHFGTGTQRVEAEVQAMFPGARTLRWDWETTRKKGSHDVILNHFVNHRADVLIGTQMLAKGLDLPLVTLVGAVLADVGLNLPDYRAAERSFQVLTQVAGRAGRSPLGGQVILQTFQPESYVIQAAAKHDYRGFYKQELKHRRDLGYPPYARLLRLEFRGRGEPAVEQAARKLAHQIRGWISEGGHRSTEMIGPVPCFYARTGGTYRWQIVLRGPDPVAILRGRNLEGCRVEIDPPSLL